MHIHVVCWCIDMLLMNTNNYEVLFIIITKLNEVHCFKCPYREPEHANVYTKLKMIMEYSKRKRWTIKYMTFS